jgi:GTP1/Obg family GTP-binding protein
LELFLLRIDPLAGRLLSGDKFKLQAYDFTTRAISAAQVESKAARNQISHN